MSKSSAARDSPGASRLGSVGTWCAEGGDRGSRMTPRLAAGRSRRGVGFVSARRGIRGSRTDRKGRSRRLAACSSCSSRSPISEPFVAPDLKTDEDGVHYNGRAKRPARVGLFFEALAPPRGPAGAGLGLRRSALGGAMSGLGLAQGPLGRARRFMGVV